MKGSIVQLFTSTAVMEVFSPQMRHLCQISYRKHTTTRFELSLKVKDTEDIQVIFKLCQQAFSLGASDIVTPAIYSPFIVCDEFREGFEALIERPETIRFLTHHFYMASMLAATKTSVMPLAAARTLTRLTDQMYPDRRKLFHYIAAPILFGWHLSDHTVERVHIPPERVW